MVAIPVKDGYVLVTAEQVKMLIMAGLALGFLVAILIGIADTRFYPLAIGIVVTALVYEAMNHPELVTTWQGLIGSAGDTLK